MARLTLSEIKARSTGYFFDRKSMKFFSAPMWSTAKQSTKYGTRYDKETDINYVVVTDPWSEKHYHKFDESTGDLNSVRKEDIPLSFKIKDLKPI